jgi:hypothetical protein
MIHIAEASEQQKSYLAGLFDGEGSINIFKAKKGDRLQPRYFLEISIGNTHQGVLNWVLEKFGGRVTHNAEQYTKRNQRTWRWRASATEAYLTLVAMEPYLVVKKEQALLAIEFQEHIHAYGATGNRHISPEEVTWRENQRAQLLARSAWRDKIEA